MKAKILSILILLAVLACSKSSDPAAASGGCTVSFQGATHTLANVICVEPTNDVDGLSATDVAGTKSVTITRDLTDPTSSMVSFTPDADDTDTYYYISESISGTAPTLSKSGKTWTFSGTAKNSSGDTESLSGTCTCN